jgi:hypothetical protein
LKDDSAYDTFLFQFLASELTTCSGSTLWECNGDIFRWFYKAKNWFISYKQKPETGLRDQFLQVSVNTHLGSSSVMVTSFDDAVLALPTRFGSDLAPISWLQKAGLVRDGRCTSLLVSMWFTADIEGLSAVFC